ncbi:MAG TPA: hypothetical protein PK254_03925 [Methanolinea sp.]|nr:hypothetical protein [Methanolinea sp.]
MIKPRRKSEENHALRATLIMCLAALVFLSCAGCVSVLTQADGERGDAGAGNGTAMRAILVRQNADWGISRGCTWETTFQVYNPGTTEERNVFLHVELVNADTGAVRDTKELYLGTISPGEERIVTLELDGECLKEYTVRAIPLVRAL